MKKVLAILCCFFAISVAMADDVVISKDKCTITKEGKTYPLHGKVQIVDAFPDITIKVVDAFPGVK